MKSVNKEELRSYVAKLWQTDKWKYKEYKLID